jgi:hypothetical protein
VTASIAIIRSAIRRTAFFFELVDAIEYIFLESYNPINYKEILLPMLLPRLALAKV